MVRCALAVVAAFVAGGCQCGFDAGKLDDVACTTESDCAPGQKCLEGTCSRMDCTEPADCGDGWAFTCDEGRCAPIPCDEAEQCPRGFGCVDDLCAAGAGPCDLHSDCDDGVFCDGSELCVDGRCEAGPPPDCGLVLGECEVAVCEESTRTCHAEPAEDGEPCEDGDPCTGPDTCRSLVCEGSGDACDDDLACTPGQCIPGVGCEVDAGACATDDACWTAGDPHPTDPCLACDPALDPRGWSPGPSVACDDGDDCTSNDSCSAGACTGTAFSCDDGLGCTDDLCDGAGGCIVEPALGSCFIGGACYASQASNPANPCERCDPAASTTSWSPDPNGTPLDDGIACTTGTCVAGQAVHTPNDAVCGNGSVCAPCAGGCQVLPTLSVDCGAGDHQPGGGTATCQIGGGVPAECLTCDARVRMSQIVRHNFDNCPWVGNIGWEIDGPAPDCDDSERLEFIDQGRFEMERRIDTRDFDAVRLCFRHLGVDMGENDGVEVWVDAGAGFREVFTQMGGPFPDTNWVSSTVCANLHELEPAAADNDDVGIRIAVETTLCMAALDDIVIEGWDSSTVDYPGRVASSDFTGCDLDGWVENGDPIACPGAVGNNAGADLVEVNDGLSTLERVMDLADRCDDIWVGFSTQVDGGFFPRDHTELNVEPGGGGDEVWLASVGDRPDELQPIELVLTHRSDEVRYAPAVTFTFELEAGAANATQWLDDVWVDGATCSNGDGILTVSPVRDVLFNPSVDVSSEVQATADVECVFDGRAATRARGPIRFRY